MRPKAVLRGPILDHEIRLSHLPQGVETLLLDYPSDKKGAEEEEGKEDPLPSTDRLKVEEDQKRLTEILEDKVRKRTAALVDD